MQWMCNECITCFLGCAASTKPPWIIFFYTRHHVQFPVWLISDISLTHIFHLLPSPHYAYLLPNCLLHLPCFTHSLWGESPRGWFEMEAMVFGVLEGKAWGWVEDSSLEMGIMLDVFWIGWPLMGVYDAMGKGGLDRVYVSKWVVKVDGCIGNSQLTHNLWTQINVKDMFQDVDVRKWPLHGMLAMKVESGRNWVISTWNLHRFDPKSTFNACWERLCFMYEGRKRW